VDLSQERKSIPRARKPISKEGVEKLRQLQNQLLQEHGGKPFENSVDLLREEREEREKELDFSSKPATLPVELLYQERKTKK
jgi:hypothetical protein